ncbi:cache domain-containing protein, partial [Campylobacter jejuni]|nr:cache domain-containing protein [Campylobacter jejuni]MCW1359090.1 cache domain-containing protein [Campylobacter jejuni]
MNSEEGLIQNTGHLLKSYRHGINALAVYIGQSNGENIVSDESSDKLKTNVIINGKANGYDATSRPWYQDAKNQNSVIASPTYIDAASKQHVISYSKALYKDGKFIGVLGIDILLTSFQNQIERIPGNAFLFDRQNQIFAAANKQLLDPSVNHTPVLNAYKANGDYNFFTYSLNEQKRLGTCTKVFTYTACVTESADVINKPVMKIAFIQTAIVIFTSIISIILLYFIVSKYLSPLAAIQTGLTSFFDFINHKTKNVSTIEVKSKDEFGQISDAINENILATKRGLEQDNQAVKESVETVSVVESGNLTARITA